MDGEIKRRHLNVTEQILQKESQQMELYQSVINSYEKILDLLQIK
jgi:hypothetical protein